MNMTFLNLNISTYMKYCFEENDRSFDIVSILIDGFDVILRYFSGLSNDIDRLIW